VRNGLTLRWSSGIVEGTVNKMIKRQMYGRAGFPLLRKRVLLAARGGSLPSRNTGRIQIQYSCADDSPPGHQTMAAAVVPAAAARRYVRVPSSCVI
jgi:hypothetical protein